MIALNSLRGGKYISNVTEIGEYRSAMRLHINPLTMNEFGAYRCVAKNSLGDTDGTIKLYSKDTRLRHATIALSFSLHFILFCVFFCCFFSYSFFTGIPSNTVNYVDNYDSNRYKGKKRVKSSELYQQSKAIGSEGDEPENPGKRKGISFQIP